MPKPANLREFVYRSLPVLMVASLACNAFGNISLATQNGAPTDTAYSTALPPSTPNLPNIDLTPIATGIVPLPSGMLFDTKQTDSDGEVVIEDAIANVRVTIEVFSDDEGEPVSNIQVNWIAEGDKFIVFATDPAARFLPAFLTGSYSAEAVVPGAVRNISYSRAHFQQGYEELKIALKLAEVVKTIKSIEDLAEYLNSWSSVVQQPGPYGIYNDYCMTGGEIHDLFSAATLILPFGGQLAAEGADLILAAIVAVSLQIFEERAEEILNSVEGKHGYRLYTTPLPFPVFTYLGRCDPADSDGGEVSIIQIGIYDSVYLQYDPKLWDAITETAAEGFINRDGDSVEALRNIAIPDCIIHDNQGMGAPSHWRRQDTRETIGNLDYRVEEWTDLNTDQVILVVYQYPYGESGYGIRIEAKPGLDPRKCILDVEDVLILSETLLWERAPAILGDRAARTEVIFFEPNGFSGNQENGACWTSSIATPREGAWRCMTQSSRIYDPCFSHSLDSESVICNPVPWDNRKGFRMILTEPLPKFVEPVQSHPWYFELEDGTVCFFLSTGTSIFTQIDDWIPYGCEDGWVIIGVPNEGVVWTAEKARLSGDYSRVEESEIVNLLKVWR